MSHTSDKGQRGLGERLRRVLVRALMLMLRWVLTSRRPDRFLARLGESVRASIMGDATLLKHLLEPESPTLRQVLLAEDSARLRKLLDADEQALPKAYLCPGSPELLRLLDADDGTRLRDALEAESHKRLRGLLAANDFAAAKAVMGTRSQMLRAVLLADDAARLKAVLAENDYALLKTIMGARSQMLRAVMAHDDYRAARLVLMEDGYAGLLRVVLPEEGKALRAVLLAEESRPFKELLRSNEYWILKKLLFERGVMNDVLALPLAEAWFEFDRQWAELRGWFPEEDPALQARLVRNRERLKTTKDVPSHMLDTVMDGEDLRLAAGDIRFADRHALWTLLHELLINQDYFADMDTDAPRILDCGAHQGLSLFYFKRCYPGARITAFEPDANNRAIAVENMRRNRFENVEVLPYAIAAEAGTARFFVPKGFSMAGSLTARRRDMGNEVEEITVECVPLNGYLNERIDYLKLDIEGSEGAVLEAAAPHLHRVHYLFCEYHHDRGLASDGLVRILDLLERVGFDTQVAKSYTYQRSSEYRPMSHVGEPYSALIFAKNRNWAGTSE